MSYRDLVLADNPVAYYPLDEPKRTRRATELVSGETKFSSWIDFGTAPHPVLGSGARIQLDSQGVDMGGTASAVDLNGVADWTVEGWFRCTRFNTGNMGIVGPSAGPIQLGVMVNTVGSTSKLRVFQNNGSPTLGIGILLAEISPNQLYYFAAAYTSANQTAYRYVNGALFSTLSIPPIANGISGRQWIGSYAGSSFQDGDIRHVAYHHQALSADTIKARYDYVRPSIERRTPKMVMTV